MTPDPREGAGAVGWVVLLLALAVIGSVITLLSEGWTW